MTQLPHGPEPGSQGGQVVVVLATQPEVAMQTCSTKPAQGEVAFVAHPTYG